MSMPGSPRRVPRVQTWMRVAVLTVLVGCADPWTVVHAQLPAYRLQWDQAEPPATVASFQYTLSVDAAAPTMLSPSRAVQGTGTRCSAPYTLPTTLPPGPHVLTVTATNSFGSASASVTGSLPSAPTTLQIVVTLTLP